MAIELNLDGVEAWEGGGGPLVPEGMYQVRVEDAAEGESRNGHKQLELDLQIADGEQRGRNLKDWVVITPNTLGRVAHLFQAAKLSWPGGTFHLEPSDFQGRSMMIVVRHEQYQGATKTRIVSYDALESEVPVDPTPVSATSKHDAEIPF